MIVIKIENIDDIKRVLCNPSIYDTIADDSCPKIEDFEPPIDDKYLYVGGYVDNAIIGVMVYHKYLDGNECHVQVLPEHRKEHAKEFGEQSLKFCGTQPLYAEIPDLYKNGVKYIVNVLRYT